MSDRELVIAAELLRLRAEALRLSLTPWEQLFITNTVSTFAVFPELSRGQKRALRQTVARVLRELPDRQDFERAHACAVAEAVAREAVKGPRVVLRKGRGIS